jgi:outer membrane protein TolC
MFMLRLLSVISAALAVNFIFLEEVKSQSNVSAISPNPPQVTLPEAKTLEPDPNLLQLPTQPVEVQIPTTQPITLNQAIALAERNNRDLQVAELTLKRSQAALRQAQAALYPKLNGDAELAYERNAKDRLNDLKYAQKDAQSTGALGGTVELSYDLFTSGRRPAQIRAAEAQTRVEQLDVERVRSQIRLEVTNAYYDLQQADEQVRIAQASVKNVQRLLSDAQALEEGGLGTKFDIIRTRVQLGNAEQELTDAQVQQEVARRQLVSILSLSEVADVSAADPVEIAGEWQPSLEASILLAYKNRVELPQQLAQREIAQQQRKAAIAGVLPQVSLFANYQTVNEFNEEFGTLQGYAAGARLRWNLFDGGAAMAAADQETQNRAIAETRYAQSRNQIRLQVEQSYKNLRANARSIQTATAALKEAREALDIAQFRFQSGVGTQLDVITAQTDLIRAESNRLRSVLNYNRALAALQRAVSQVTSPSPSQKPKS